MLVRFCHFFCAKYRHLFDTGISQNTNHVSVHITKAKHAQCLSPVLYTEQAILSGISPSSSFNPSVSDVGSYRLAWLVAVHMHWYVCGGYIPMFTIVIKPVKKDYVKTGKGRVWRSKADYFWPRHTRCIIILLYFSHCLRSHSMPGSWLTGLSKNPSTVLPWVVLI